MIMRAIGFGTSVTAHRPVVMGSWVNFVTTHRTGELRRFESYSMLRVGSLVIVEG
jgi:hypothetical protein